MISEDRWPEKTIIDAVSRELVNRTGPGEKEFLHFTDIVSHWEDMSEENRNEPRSLVGNILLCLELAGYSISKKEAIFKHKKAHGI